MYPVFDYLGFQYWGSTWWLSEAAKLDYRGVEGEACAARGLWTTRFSSTFK